MSAGRAGASIRRDTRHGAPENAWFATVAKPVSSVRSASRRWAIRSEGGRSRSVVATQKHRKFDGAKLLLVQPLNLDETPRGVAVLAVDSVGAGVHEKVLVVLEGRAAGDALNRKAAPVDAAIVGIIDHVECDAD